MPNAYILNQKPFGNGPAMSLIVEMLISAGWTYQSSGTGTTGIFSPAPATVTISNASPGIVSWASHGILPNVPVVFTTTGSLPPEISSGVTYYVTAANFTANSFSVSATLGGAAINTSAASTATTTATVKKVFTTAVAPTPVIISNSSPATLYWPAHGLHAGDSLRLTTTSSLPSGLASGTTYFVLSTGLATDSFRLATSAEGTAINTTTAGSGVHTATVLTSWGNGTTTTANAWARIQDPGGTREFLFQHDNNISSGSSASGSKIRYSASAKFIGTANGGISATNPPTAADERYLRGSSATFGSNWFHYGVLTGSNIFQGAAMSAAPYGWWFACQTQGAGNRFTGMLFDPVVSVAEDTDPYVIHIGGGSTASPFEAFSVNPLGQAISSFGKDGGTASNWQIACGSTTPGAFAYMDSTRTVFDNVLPLGYACTSVSQTLGMINGANGVTTNPVVLNPATLASNPFNNKLDALPVAWVRLALPTSTQGAGLKGWSTMLRWTATNRVSFADTLNNKAWICVGAFWLPWDGTTTPSHS